jgi:serine/threonine-protein kinase
MPEPEVVALGIQLAAALREAHQCGVIHRDLKPGNIMLTADGHAKVLDFGLALLQTEGTDTISKVKLEGTVQYIAPEVLRGAVPDERSDVFSLGAVLYEMATGRSPHARDSFAGMVESILYKPPVPPEQIVPGISASLAGVIKKSLETEPALRYQSAADLRADLLAMQSGTVLDLSRVRPARRWWRVVTLVLVAAAAALLLLWAGGRLRFGAAMPQKKVVAVLPFEAIGGNPEDQALSRGLTDLVTVRLAQVGARYGFEVVPASEVRQQEIASSEQARQKLGASLVVEGSWEFGGQQRIMYALVDTGRKRNLDAAVVSADMGHLYSAENDVLQKLLGMFDVEKGGSPPVGFGPERPDAYQYYVRGRGYLGDYQNPQSLDRAIALFKVATDSDPKFALAYAGLGEAYWRRYEDTKDPQWVQAAIAACDRASAIDRKLSPLQSTLGLIYHGTGKQQQAVDSFEQSLRLDATNNTASRGLAASYESLAQFDKAETAYRQAIALRPDYWGGYHDLGVYFYKRGQLDQAARQFSREIELVPENSRGYSDLGGIYYLQNRFAEARRMFQESVKIQPNYRAYSNLGTMDFFDRKYSDAAANFEQALKINARDGRIWRNLGWSYFWGGQTGKATPAFQRAAELLEQQRSVNPNDGAVLILLADCYSMTGEVSKSEPLLKEGLAQTNDAESAFRGTEIYEKLGKRELALDWLKTAIARGYVVSEVEKDPSLADLRKDPRYANVIQAPQKQ